MKKIIVLVLTCVILLSALLTGCEREMAGPQVDQEKTQLYIYNCYGGMKDEWLNNAARAFEELHKDDTNWEEGKKGVQVVVDNALVAKAQGTALINTIDNERGYIYFTEYVYYNEWVKSGKMKDISSYVNTALSEYGESESIADKLDTNVKNYLYRGEQIYALPFYDYLFGWYYDADLFKKYGFYFRDGASADGIDRDTYDLSSLFVTPRDEFDDTPEDTKSVGADGISGTYDDGLPVTYDDFYALCDYMLMFDVQPLYWGSYDGYLQGMFQSFWVENEGKDGFYNSFEFNKGASNLIDTINQDGSYTTMSKTADEISTNEELLTKQQSRYQALQFLKVVMDNPAWFGCDDNTSLMASFKASNIESQSRYLKSKYESSLKTTAIFQEGSYWVSEAASEFTTNAQKYGSSASLTNRGIMLMPMPRASRTNTAHTFATTSPTFMFVSSKTPDSIMPLVGEFIRFFSTDKQMAEFTKTTGVTRAAMDYDVDDFTNWSPYAKSMYYYHKNSVFCYPFSSNNKVRLNESYYGAVLFNKSTINGTTYSSVYKMLYDNKFSVKSIFDGMYVYQSENNPK